MMVCVNERTGMTRTCRPIAPCSSAQSVRPHIAEELWEQLGRKFPGFEGTADAQPWPIHDEALLVDNEVEIVLQINGKVREKLVVPKDASREEIEAAARSHEKFSAHLAGRETIKVIAVPGKLVNFVVKG